MRDDVSRLVGVDGVVVTGVVEIGRQLELRSSWRLRWRVVAGADGRRWW
jgi:hypothetical protein